MDVYRLVSFNNSELDRYERVKLQPGIPCRNHRTVMNQGGKEFTVHLSELMFSGRRVLTLNHPHHQE